MTTDTTRLTSGHNPLAHSRAEDLLAILIGTTFIGFGMAMFVQAGLLTGGTAGIAFLLHYQGLAPFGWLFFLINLPFYLLALRHMGAAFTVRTFVCVALVSLLSTQCRELFPFAGTLNPYSTGLLGGLLLGMGLIALFRHKASVGGINILALYVQQRYGLRAGKLQFGIDLLILLASLLLCSLPQLIGSLIGAAAMSLVIGFYHRPDRYIAAS
ncbi:membrane protein [Vogesella sp. EB]|uniref:YitT family protein n=1 Tax=Vogesella sp. EB TaxID=1526735 RepID=UPI00064CE249|nr:YitT family protein [Vogesella sp. EB]KMJ52138.1 membrane protein [Vogesella sp. EB]